MNNLTVVFSTREVRPEFIELIKQTCGVKKINVIGIENKGDKSLTEIYQDNLDKSDSDVILFCHDDIKFDTDNWGRKLLNHFKRDKEVGIVGVAGTRYMAESGRWWEDFSKMHGAVNHEHEGKRWLSKYSNSTGNKLQEVLLVDGLFFAVHKKRIKENFNLEIGGFHFYEVDFCFRNYLKGVKIGVSSDIRLTHKSVGMTNDEWEKKREVFAKQYKNDLPKFLPLKLDYKKQLKILIGCLNFNDTTGSELYIFELAKALKKLGNDVTICSNIGGSISKKAEAYGINLTSLNEPPGYKLGDGKWQLNTENGIITSKPNTLYKIKDVKFDVLHLNHKPVVERLLPLYPLANVICTIHSEVLELEHPIINPRITKYIAIRPEIKEFLIKQFKISEDKIDIIYNPFDVERFKKYPLPPKTEKEVILFVGTIDYLRQDTILDLIEKTKKNNQILRIVGKKRVNFLDNINEPHVEYYEPVWNVENYIRDVNKTAGILLGRTTIEGWLCGRPGIMYHIDESGMINSIEEVDPPENLDKFNSINVAKEVIKTYFEKL
tara:strand:- start:1487 stop:3133 length:1647 start_codon:yes stop_codon:yes gene_type:complete